MMDFSAALAAFWNRLGVPAYLTELVPDDAVLPYLTYDMARASFGGVTPLTVYNWHKDTLGGNVERTEMLDRIAEAIPVGGVMLDVLDGYIILTRGDGIYQQDWQDSNDPGVIGGRTSYFAQYYTTK